MGAPSPRRLSGRGPAEQRSARKPDTPLTTVDSHAAQDYLWRFTDRQKQRACLTRRLSVREKEKEIRRRRQRRQDRLKKRRQAAMTGGTSAASGAAKSPRKAESAAPAAPAPAPAAPLPESPAEREPNPSA